jgi:PAS domain S-box-containing protein
MAILSPEKNLIEVNRRLCKMLGYAEMDLLEKRWADLIHCDDRAREEAAIHRLLDGTVSGHTAAPRFVQKGGKVLHTNMSLQCMRKSDGAIDSILVLVQEATPTREAGDIGRLSQV